MFIKQYKTLTCQRHLIRRFIDGVQQLVMVDEMVPGKPAAECGVLFIGDRISAVNGQGTRGHSHDAIIRMLKSAGPALEIMVLSAHRRSSGRAAAVVATRRNSPASARSAVHTASPTTPSVASQSPLVSTPSSAARVSDLGDRRDSTVASSDPVAEASGALVGGSPQAQSAASQPLAPAITPLIVKRPAVAPQSTPQSITGAVTSRVQSARNSFGTQPSAGMEFVQNSELKDEDALFGGY